MTVMSPLIQDDRGWESSETFREGMRQLASGVSIVTGGTMAMPVGLVATAVCSVSVEPATLLVSINHAASAFATISATERLTVNVLGTQHEDLVAQFSRPERRGERFRSGPWVGEGVDPPVLEDALAVFECRVVQSHPYFTHTLFLARPERVRVSGGRPLVYFSRGFSGLAG
jgi:flavin reductase